MFFNCDYSIRNRKFLNKIIKTELNNGTLLSVSYSGIHLLPWLKAAVWHTVHIVPPGWSSIMFLKSQYVLSSQTAEMTPLVAILPARGPSKVAHSGGGYRRQSTPVLREFPYGSFFKKVTIWRLKLSKIKSCPILFILGSFLSSGLAQCETTSSVARFERNWISPYKMTTEFT